MAPYSLRIKSNSQYSLSPASSLASPWATLSLAVPLQPCPSGPGPRRAVLSSSTALLLAASLKQLTLIPQVSAQTSLHSLIHSTVFIRCLLSARKSRRPWGQSREQSTPRSLPSWGSHASSKKSFLLSPQHTHTMCVPPVACCHSALTSL